MQMLILIIKTSAQGALYKFRGTTWGGEKVIYMWILPKQGREERPHMIQDGEGGRMGLGGIREESSPHFWEGLKRNISECFLKRSRKEYAWSGKGMFFFLLSFTVYLCGREY